MHVHMCIWLYIYMCLHIYMLIYIYEYVGMVRCMYLYLEEAGFWAVTPWPASWCSVGGGGSVYSAYCLHPCPPKENVEHWGYTQ